MLGRTMRTLLALMMLGMAHGFVAHAPACSANSARRCATSMGPAKDGPFTPAVLAAKVVFGEKFVLKWRGKAISYHSQYINEFCSECKCR